jgi:hypothetical protein
MILEIQLMLPKRRATRFRLKNPISPQFRAPMIETVNAKQFRNLFSIDDHPFLVLVVLVFHKVKKIFAVDLLRIFRKKLLNF